jgi:cytochrome P450 family 6
MISALEIFALVSVILSLAYYFVKRKYSYWKDMGVPYLEPVFPFGNMKGSGKKFHFSEVMTRAYKEGKTTNSPICGLYFFFYPVVVVSSLEFAKKILVQDAANFLDRGSYYNQDDDPLSVSQRPKFMMTHTNSFKLRRICSVSTILNGEFCEQN